MENYLLHLAVVAGVYSLLVYSINLVTGFGGLLPFCQAAFYGLGAYAYALTTAKGGLSSELLFAGHQPFIIGLLSAILAGALGALAMGLLSLRFRGDFFVFATLGFQMIVFAVLYNWTSLGRGAFGIYGIQPPQLFGWQIDTRWEFALLAALANLAALPVLFTLYRSPFGLGLKALRDNERAAESLGISAFRQHLSALIVAGGCAGMAGALYASYITYIDPTSFDLRESVFLVSVLLLGGSGNRKGPIVGVVVMTLLPEALRFLGLPTHVAANLREVIYGLALILLMYWRPKGLAGDFALR